MTIATAPHILDTKVFRGDDVQHEASLLLVTHVPIGAGSRGPLIDDQTAAGIAQWCRHFDRVTYYGIADQAEAAGASSSAWIDTIDRFGGRAEVMALPRAYGIRAMLREYGGVRAMLRREIPRHRHLCFTFGGVVGDWPAIAAREAIRQGRCYGAWIDRVEAPVIRDRLDGASLRRRLAAAVAIPAGEYNTRFLIRHSTVALLQGRDTFNHYAACASDPHCTYDTHTGVADRIDAQALTAKCARVREGRPLRIVYAGRAAPMKGPQDWLDTLEQLRVRAVPFKATWVGDGPELAAMRRRISQSGLAEVIDLPGFESDREKLLRRLRDSDMLLFNHKTPESARCLIEALVSGCPLVGYESAYPQGLVAAHGGGSFAPIGDTAALADRVAALHEDRPHLAQLITDAAASGKLYDEDSVYAHRAALMRRACDEAPS